MRISTFVRLTCSLCVLVLMTGSAMASDPASPGGPPDWKLIGDQETVHVLTTDADGDARATKIWVLVLDGVGYIRTSDSTTWGDNVEREPEIALRVGVLEHPLHATFITDTADRERIVTGFIAKYGDNPIMKLIRGNPRIMRLSPRL